MSKTTQCQKPLPVGASGSYTLRAKLLVPSGAPDQLSAGEMFFPGQPIMEEATCSSDILAPGSMSGLVNDRACAPPDAGVAENNAAPKANPRIVHFLPQRQPHGSVPAAQPYSAECGRSRKHPFYFVAAPALARHRSHARLICVSLVRAVAAASAGVRNVTGPIREASACRRAPTSVQTPLQPACRCVLPMTNTPFPRIL